MDQAPLAALEDLDDEEHGEAAPDAAQEGVGDGQRHHAAVTRVGDPALRAAVECKESENENERSKTYKRHGMTRERNTLNQKILSEVQRNRHIDVTFGPNLPSLGPSMMAPTRAQVPPPR